ncbi:hypothetical protein BUZ94_13015 [Mammaliicoccus sciuri]|nr:hypothetical protein BUZ94_13015 [Mammaliicoccus sciuri]
MNKYIKLMINKFESYIYMLDSVEPNNKAAEYLNENMILKEISKVGYFLKSTKTDIQKDKLYRDYLDILEIIYKEVSSTSNKRNAMIESLNNAIHKLNQINKELEYENH